MLEARTITASERRLVEWLLTNVPDTKQVANYIAQLDKLRVIDVCGCGCGSLTFCTPQGGMEQIASTTGHSPEGTSVWVCLYADESDSLCALDINPMDDMPDAGIGLPNPESLFRD